MPHLVNHSEGLTAKSVKNLNFDEIAEQAELRYPENLNLDDILSSEDFQKVDEVVKQHISEFNKRYQFGWMGLCNWCWMWCICYVA